MPINEDDIPVTFEFEGTQRKGFLSRVMGAGGGSVYDLTVDRFHWGQLFYITGHPGFDDGGLHSVQAGWRFTSNNHEELRRLADYFGNIVELWNE